MRQANYHRISTKKMSIEEVYTLCQGEMILKLSDHSKQLIQTCRHFLDKKINESTEPIYGINTGFGSLHKKVVLPDRMIKLQENLVKSHACGAGKQIPNNLVRLMMFLKIQSLSLGYSGVELLTLERIINFFNHKIHPVVFQMGSLGASGDLVPLAHLALPLLGLGEVNYKGEKISSREILKKYHWNPIIFNSKEGLALLNGTQFMSSYGVYCTVHAKYLLKWANLISAISFEAFDCRIDPFDKCVHKIRRQIGQKAIAKDFRKLLKGSEFVTKHKDNVQDPYSFRCIPQVHGASKDTIDFVDKIFQNEINGVSDNPNIFVKENKIISAGNFHGQPLAYGLDFMCIALSELGNISERRVYQLVSGGRNLPEYLIKNCGENSGLMILQYTAASISSQNKQYSVPSSTDSIPSSNGQEDHVSMGANAALKCYEVVQNLYTLLAIELIVATQAIQFRKPLKTSEKLEKVIFDFREIVSYVEEDRVFHYDIKNAVEFLKKNAVADYY